MFTVPLSIIFPQVLMASFRLGPWTRTAFDRSSLCVQWKAMFSPMDIFCLFVCYSLFGQSIDCTIHRMEGCPQFNNMLREKTPHVSLNPEHWQLHLMAMSLCIRMWRNDPFSHSSCHYFGHRSSLQESLFQIDKSQTARYLLH